MSVQDSISSFNVLWWTWVNVFYRLVFLSHLCLSFCLSLLLPVSLCVSLCVYVSVSVSLSLTYSGSNTDYMSSEPLKPLLCYVMLSVLPQQWITIITVCFTIAVVKDWNPCRTTGDYATRVKTRSTVCGSTVINEEVKICGAVKFSSLSYLLLTMALATPFMSLVVDHW